MLWDECTNTFIIGIRSINIDNSFDGMTNSIFQMHICNNVLCLMGFNKYDHQIFTDFSINAHFSMSIYLPFLSQLPRNFCLVFQAPPSLCKHKLEGSSFILLLSHYVRFSQFYRHFEILNRKTGYYWNFFCFSSSFDETWWNCSTHE